MGSRIKKQQVICFLLSLCLQLIETGMLGTEMNPLSLCWRPNTNFGFSPFIYFLKLIQEEIQSFFYSHCHYCFYKPSTGILILLKTYKLGASLSLTGQS